ncbi:MAG: hypothetical protein KDL87_16740, partial [Verrucomicrobiae bacterium]|nr:hypothetical protein [Verrucomicrobiae bacterium]
TRTGGGIVRIDPETLDVTGLASNTNAFKLALSSDGTSILVLNALSIGNTLERRSLPGFTIEHTYHSGLSETGLRRQIVDFCPLGADGGRVALALRWVDSSKQVGCYEVRTDAGVQARTTEFLLTNSYQPYDVPNLVEPCVNPDEFCGITTSILTRWRMEAGALTEIARSDLGVSLIAAFPVSGPWHHCVKSDGHGRLCFTNGSEFSEISLKKVGSTTVGALKGVAPEPEAERTFLLGSVPSPHIKARQRDSFEVVGTCDLPLQSGLNDNGDLIRWGANGFAFPIRGGIAFLSHNALVPGNPEADLVVTVSPTKSRITTGSAAVLQVRVENKGPRTAEQVVVTLDRSGSVGIKSVVAAGAEVTPDYSTTVRFPRIRAGETRSVTVKSHVAEMAGLLVCRARVISNAAEDDYGNNSSFAEVPILFGPTDTRRIIGLPTNSMIANPQEGSIWINVTSFGRDSFPDCVMSIEPSTGRILR